eukprot:CAMPEP_0184532596 /NCGR_PEP_ID=MMETSP0198_2-20121128/14255_1 /TAXON_ID=1112570 /ORGANISM="Thraustochytrium sp., Strain LLF1b" /LENGTH=31 /DNA_ID= /DNA_START= /DNA_END= /DNA_ORIENTATION=
MSNAHAQQQQPIAAGLHREHLSGDSSLDHAL